MGRHTKDENTPTTEMDHRSSNRKLKSRLRIPPYLPAANAKAQPSVPKHKQG